MLCYNCFHDNDEGASFCAHCGRRLDEANPSGTLPAGSILNGRYIVGRVLGQGGFGITYKAYDHRLNRIVAVKEYYPESLCGRSENHISVASSSNGRDDFSWGRSQFLKEAQTLARLANVQGIAHVHEYFEENGTVYFSMTYVEGQDLKDWIEAQGGRVSWQRLSRIVYPVMDALCEVHKTGLIHRDVAPDNICVTKSGRGVLLDFGAARVSLGGRSQSLSVVLKHGYAPKEQYYTKGHQGPWTDVYAMGATIYRCLTGEVLPESLERSEALTQGMRDPLRPIGDYVSVEPWVEEAVERAMEVDASNRFQSMGEFEAALKDGESQPSGVRLEEAFAVLYEDGSLVFQRGESVGRHMRVLYADNVDPERPWWTGDSDGESGEIRGDWCRSVRSISSKVPIIASGSIGMLFSCCHNLQDISGLREWDVSQVTEMPGLFRRCESLRDIGALESWDTSSVTDMWGAFSGCTLLRNVSPLSGWDVSSVRDMEVMFRGCSTLSSVSALSGWDVSSVTDMGRMFASCPCVPGFSSLSGWDVSPNAKVDDAFEGCERPYPIWYERPLDDDLIDEPDHPGPIDDPPNPPEPPLPPEPITPPNPPQPVPPTPNPPKPPTPKELYADKLAQAKRHGWGMGWYKFVIYVQCFLSAAVSFMAACIRLTGSEFGTAAGAVYGQFPALQVLDIGDGLALLLLGALFIYTRFQLKLFTNNGRKLYLGIWEACVIVYGLHMLVAAVITGHPGYYLGPFNLVVLVVGIGIAIYNYRYFGKREELFDN